MNNEDVFICELCEDTKVIGEESDIIQRFARVYQVVGDEVEIFVSHNVFGVHIGGDSYFQDDTYESDWTDIVRNHCGFTYFEDFLKALEEVVNG